MNIANNIKMIICLLLLALAFNSSAKHTDSKRNGKQAKLEDVSFWKGMQWGSIINFENETVDESYVKGNALLYDVNFVFSKYPINDDAQDTASNKQFVYFTFMQTEDKEALEVWNRQYSIINGRNDSEIELEPFTITKNDSINPFNFGMGYKRSNDSIFFQCKRDTTYIGPSSGINGHWKMGHYNMVFMPMGTPHKHREEKTGFCLEEKYDYLNNFKSREKGIMYIYFKDDKVGDLRYFYWIENNKVYLLNKPKNYLMVLPYKLSNNGNKLSWIITKHEMPQAISKKVKIPQTK
ncbi:MAG: hypothetical protein J6I79_04115 [Paludibacteraceae bacterium]|nr:hypothetical protein [Paludibacteraceae bacterium]